MQTKITPSYDNAYRYPLLIKSLLLSSQRYGSDREIVYRDRVRYDYAMLNLRIRKFANVLKGAGVKAGDAVAVMDWDSHRYLEAYFAIPMIGAVLHHVNIRLSPEQIIYTMNHAEDDFVLVHDDFLSLIEPVEGQLSGVRGFIQLTDNGSPAPTSLPVIGEYEALLALADDQYEFADFDENSMATTFYTINATGNPKGVYFSHRQLVLHTLNAATTLGSHDALPLLRSNDVYMPMTPMFHVHAWGVPYVATMLGIKQVYPGRYDPDLLVRLFREENVTFSHGVPEVLQMILHSEEVRTTELAGWKILIGGSTPARSLASQLTERGIQLHSCYGMSETCPLLTTTYLHPDIRALVAGEQLSEQINKGLPIGLVDLRILDANGKDVPHDGESMGEVVVRAPWLTQGYRKDPERNAELWASGWLHTGDFASIDSRGVPQFQGRIKDVIKTGGEWISSLELESLISQCHGVADVAVVGVPDDHWGERPCALVVAARGAAIDADQIREHLRQFVQLGQINKWAIPKQIIIGDSIPRTSVGKSDKKRIRETYARNSVCNLLR